MGRIVRLRVVDDEQPSGHLPTFQRPNYFQNPIPVDISVYLPPENLLFFLCGMTIPFCCFTLIHLPALNGRPENL